MTISLPASSTPAHAKRLMNRNFTLLWLGQSVSQMGIQAFDVALVLWIKQATDSATLMGFILMLSTFPAVVLGPIGGALADRYSRRTIIIVSDLLSGIALFSLVILMTSYANATEVIIAGLFVVSFCLAVLSSFFRPALTAAVPDLVPASKLPTANSLVQMTYQLAVFLGQGSGGTLFRVLGAPLLLLINGITYSVAAFSSMLITIPQVLTQQSRSWQEQLGGLRQDLSEGVKYVWNRKGLREMFFVSIFLSFFTTPVIILLPFFVEDTLKVTTDWYGYMLATYGVGSLFGYLLAGIVPGSGRMRSRLTLVLIIAESGGYGLLGLAPTAPIAVVLAFAGGLAGGWVTVNITTIMQITTPDEIRGRVFGLLGALSGSITPIAMGLSGLVADALNQNIPLIYVSCGVIMTLLTLMLSLNRDFRNFLAYEAVAIPPQPSMDVSVAAE